MDHHLGDPFDLMSVWYRGTTLLVLFKTNVPQVQDTGNNAKEILGTWEVVRRAGREDGGRLIDKRHHKSDFRNLKLSILIQKSML